MTLRGGAPLRGLVEGRQGAPVDRGEEGSDEAGDAIRFGIDALENLPLELDSHEAMRLLRLHIELTELHASPPHELRGDPRRPRTEVQSHGAHAEPGRGRRKQAEPEAGIIAPRDPDVWVPFGAEGLEDGFEDRHHAWPERFAMRRADTPLRQSHRSLPAHTVARGTRPVRPTGEA